MNICHLINKYDIKRFHRTLKPLYENFEKENVHNLYIYLQDEEHINLKESQDNLEIVKLRSGNLLAQLFQLFWILQKKDVQAVHTHHITTLKLGSLLSRFLNIKGVHSVNQKYRYCIAKFYWKGYKNIIATSEYIKNDLVLTQKLKSKKVQVIHDAYNPDENPAQTLKSKEEVELRKSLGLKEDSCILGNLSPLVAESDQATIIKCLKKLISREENVELVIFGQGPLEEQIYKLAEEYQVAPHVKIISAYDQQGPIPDIIDILIISSYVEQDPQLILKAMSQGIPVVATQIGAHGEYVEHRKTGYLVPCGFPERIESAVKMLLAIPHLVEQTGKAAQKRAGTLFGIANHIEAYSQIYSQ